MQPPYFRLCFLTAVHTARFDFQFNRLVGGLVRPPGVNGCVPG